MSRTLLFVDDELQILKSFKRLFADSNYNILFANSGSEALELLKTEPVDLIISDMRMPEMDGIQLLNTVKAKYPSVVRAILSGYSDNQLIFKSVSQNLAKLYLYKPWQNEELISQIDHIFKLKDQLATLRITDSLISLEDLPTQNETYNTLCQLIEQEASIETISTVIEQDIALSSRILRIANSACFGARTPSINQALVFLGIKHIKEIVLTCTLFERPLLSQKYQKYRDALWQHSVLCNQILSGIYIKLLKIKIPDESQMAGLLHDIGRVIMLDQQPASYEVLSSYLEAQLISEALETETELFGINHADLGGILMDWWDYPLSLIDVTLNHHHPLVGSTRQNTLTLALHLADLLANNPRKIPLEQLVPQAILDELKINVQQLYELMDTIIVEAS